MTQRTMTGGRGLLAHSSRNGAKDSNLAEQAVDSVGDIFSQVRDNASILEQRVLRDVGAERMSKGLGWFSIGLGTVELVAPHLVARVCGMPGKNTALIRLFGLRELIAGIGIFSEGKKPVKSMWFRVAGDVIDLASLASGVLSPRTNKLALAFSTANVLAVTALDVIAAQELSRQSGLISNTGEVRVKKSVFVNKSPEECYQFWKRFDQFPSFMRHLVSVETNGDGKSHWVARGPAGLKIEWDAKVTADLPNQSIAWESLPGAEIHNKGRVVFEQAPGNRGTYVQVEIEYAAPGGIMGATLARLFREEPLPQLKDDLRRFKQMIEVGEVIRSDGSPEGNGQIFQKPGRPVGNQ